jgi:hypothetical protein
MNRTEQQLERRKQSTEAFLKYLRENGGLLQIAEVASTLQVSEDAVRALIQEHKLVALSENLGGEIPGFQLAEREILPYLDELLPMLLAKGSEVAVCGFLLGEPIQDGEVHTTIAEALRKGATDVQLEEIRREARLWFTDVGR